MGSRVTDGQDLIWMQKMLVHLSAKVRSNDDFIFYNQLQSKDGSVVVYQGDNRTGEGDGDDEVVEVQLSALSSDIEKVVLGVTIHDADGRRQTWNGECNVCSCCE